MKNSTQQELRDSSGGEAITAGRFHPSGADGCWHLLLKGRKKVNLSRAELQEVYQNPLEFHADRHHVTQV